MQPVKKWYESKLVWLGVLQVAGAGITASMDVGATWQTISMAVVGAATIAFRAITTTSVTK